VIRVAVTLRSGVNCVLSVCFGVAFALSSTSSADADDSGLSLDALLTDVQRVLIKVRDATQSDDLPTLKAVHLDLKAAVEKEADGTVKLYVLEVGTNAKSDTVQEIKVDLTPPQPADKSPVSASVAPLADAIIGAARSVKQAGSRDPPLHLKQLEATISFAVERAANGSAGFHLLPISFDLTGKIQSSSVQQVSIVFSGPD
jgi:hypothetical protein